MGGKTDNLEKRMKAFPSHPPVFLGCPSHQIPMWQLCTQMRCPSYLQLHFIALLVKSLSATSKLGLMTTCEGEKGNIIQRCQINTPSTC